MVDAERDARSYGEENTFGTDVRDDRTVREAIIAHGEAVARRLRRDGVRAATVVLKIKLAERLGAGKYRILTRQAPLPAASDDGAAITAVALGLWDRHRPRRAVRLIGVSARGIDGARDAQLVLFDDAGRATRIRLNAALDRIVARYGADSIGRAVGKPEKASPTLQLKRGEPDRP
jgi:DNA polymerase-4